MEDGAVLDRVEHHLLSMQVDDVEPLHILYADTSRDIEGAALERVLQALVKLVNMGFSKCYLVNDEWQPCNQVTLQDLKRRFEGQTEEEQKKYPDVPEYYFEITESGKIEEAKEIYDAYYPDS